MLRIFIKDITFRVCTICPEGSYCPSTSETPKLCTDKYSLKGYTQCVDYAPNSLKLTDDLPTFCKPGTYIDTTDKSCKECSSGYYCDGVTKTQCEDGYYSDTTSAAICTKCPGGRNCQKSNLASLSALVTYLEPDVNIIV